MERLPTECKHPLELFLALVATRHCRPELPNRLYMDG